MLHSTELSMASTFTKTTENGGISVAQASTTSWGVNASVSGFGGAASVETSVDKEGKEVRPRSTKLKMQSSGIYSRLNEASKLCRALSRGKCETNKMTFRRCWKGNLTLFSFSVLTCRCL